MYFWSKWWICAAQFLHLFSHLYHQTVLTAISTYFINAKTIITVSQSCRIAVLFVYFENGTMILSHPHNFIYLFCFHLIRYQFDITNTINKNGKAACWAEHSDFAACSFLYYFSLSKPFIVIIIIFPMYNIRDNR